MANVNNINNLMLQVHIRHILLFVDLALHPMTKYLSSWLSTAMLSSLCLQHKSPIQQSDQFLWAMVQKMIHLRNMSVIWQGTNIGKFFFFMWNLVKFKTTARNNNIFKSEWNFDEWGIPDYLCLNLNSN